MACVLFIFRAICVFLFSRGRLGLSITQHEKALFHFKIPSPKFPMKMSLGVPNYIFVFSWIHIFIKEDKHLSKDQWALSIQCKRGSKEELRKWGKAQPGSTRCNTGYKIMGYTTCYYYRGKTKSPATMIRKLGVNILNKTFSLLV